MINKIQNFVESQLMGDSIPESIVIKEIRYSSLLTGCKTISERNEKFHALSDEDKRREIAYDAITLVIIGKMQPNPGGYWDRPLYDLRNSLDEREASSALFQKKLIKSLPTCEVCQRGLMMVSLIRLGNRISPAGRCVDMGSEDNLQGFSLDSFKLMEHEYEYKSFNHPYENRTKEKLANICCNVIFNGEFNTEDRKDYLTEWGIKL